MRWVTYREDGSERAGVLAGECGDLLRAHFAAHREDDADPGPEAR